MAANATEMAMLLGQVHLDPPPQIHTRKKSSERKDSVCSINPEDDGGVGGEVFSKILDSPSVMDQSQDNIRLSDPLSCVSTIF